MNEQDIRDYFSGNWVFWLLNRLPPIVIILVIPSSIFVLSLVIAALIGNFKLFVCNLLAYPVGLIVALSAYVWFAVYFPKYLAQIYPAFDVSSEKFAEKIKKWADIFANRYWFIGAATVVVGVANYFNLDSLWQREIWLGDVWAASASPLFFKAHYAFIDVFAGSFILGSGIIGVLGVMVLLYDLFSLRVKLSHVRLLRPIANFSIWLSFWALLAFALVGPIRAVSAPNILCDRQSIISVDSAIVLSNFGTSILASIVVVCSLLLPVYFAHRSIIRDKKLQISTLLEIQAELFIKADRLSNHYKSALAEEKLPGKKKDISKRLEVLNLDLKQTYENIANIKKMIEEVESVPDWPFTIGNVRGMIAAAISPTLSNLLISLLPGQTGMTFIDALKKAIPDVIKNIFK